MPFRVRAEQAHESNPGSDARLLARWVPGPSYCSSPLSIRSNSERDPRLPQGSARSGKHFQPVLESTVELATPTSSPRARKAVLLVVPEGVVPPGRDKPDAADALETGLGAIP